MVKRGADEQGTSSATASKQGEKDSTEAEDVITVKKPKVLPFEETYLRSIPSSSQYEKSFMHRDVITHVLAAQTDFIITASHDGHVKFWKKKHAEGVEFVKHFRTHLGPILHMAVNHNGTLMATVCSQDKSSKVFDIPNFDMINMLRLDFVPRTAGWIHQGSDIIQALAISDSESGVIKIYDGKGLATPIHVLDKLHSKPVRFIEYNAIFDVAISIDDGGMMEYWTGPRGEYSFPTNMDWQYKTETDLYEFLKMKTYPLAVKISPNGRLIATFGADRRIRIFDCLTAKIVKEIDETLGYYQAAAKDSNRPFGLQNMEWSRRISVERELDRDPENFRLVSIAFDESSNFLIYPTMLGIKVYNLVTETTVREMGKPENMRFLGVSLCRAVPTASERLQGAALTMEREAAENPVIRRFEPDPMLVCSAYKKHRFYLFTNAEPFMNNDKDSEGLTERDIFNEKPLKEDSITAIESNEADTRITEGAILHTSMGDIHLKLYARECPKTVENFCTHARRGYYNGHQFHRVIKSFMVQTGDPTGKGTGGQSIWGADFADEFHPNVKHDKPYKISMANAGPNTNGSQFFITVVPAEWLDGKNTCFGEVTEGFNAVQKINHVSTYEKSGRPKKEINIISITLK